MVDREEATSTDIGNYRHSRAMKENKSQGDFQPAELMGRWSVMTLPGTGRKHWGKTRLRGGL